LWRGCREEDAIVTTIDTVNDSQIRGLQRAAAEAGDLEQVALCRLACGDEEFASQSEIHAARVKCVRALRDAEVQS
jgi:hypothetical protein